MLGAKNLRIVTRTLFEKNPSFLEKKRSFVLKKAVFRFFGNLWKNGSKDFAKNLTKCGGNYPL
jgi:hypothetical protein